MSAIYGFIRESAEFFQDSSLEAMSRSLAHRGMDRVGAWSRHEAEIGHRLNAIAPESRHERQPWQGEASNLVITCDARLDNREELLGRVALPGRRAAEATDAQIILAAFQKWGEACVDYLDGDFAFAIWNPQRAELFAARDRLGVKPFCYFVSENGFAFASEIKALLVSESVPAEVDERNVGRYLLDIPHPADETFYSAIRRLPPAHRLFYQRGAGRVQRYWELRAAPELKLPSNEAYAYAMGVELNKAVRRRTRTQLKIGSMLSGGLDSSSVALLAANELGSRGQKLETFSNVFGEVPECDESAFIRQIINDETMSAHFCPGDHSGPLTDIDSMLRAQDGPFSAPGLYLNCRLNAAARDGGVGVLLDGHGGDETVSLGHVYPKELARQGRLLALWRECRGLAAAYNDSAASLFRTYVGSFPPVSVLTNSFLYRGAREVMGGRGMVPQPINHKPIKWLSALNPEFCARHSLLDEVHAQAARHPSHCATDREAQLHILKSPAQAAALETLDRSAAAYGIEPRFPFVDKALMEFCLSLPAAQKLHRGWSRVVMRRAMKALPPEVRWRRDKTDLSKNFQRGLQLYDAAALRSIILDESARAAGFLSLPALERNFARYQSASQPAHGRDSLMLWKIAVIIRWLGQKRKFAERRAQAPFAASLPI